MILTIEAGVFLTFLTSKRFLPSAPLSAAPAFLLIAFFAGAVDPEGASVISTSAIVFFAWKVERYGGVDWSFSGGGGCPPAVVKVLDI